MTSESIWPPSRARRRRRPKVDDHDPDARLAIITGGILVVAVVVRCQMAATIVCARTPASSSACPSRPNLNPTACRSAGQPACLPAANPNRAPNPDPDLRSRAPIRMRTAGASSIRAPAPGPDLIARTRFQPKRRAPRPARSHDRAELIVRAPARRRRPLRLDKQTKDPPADDNNNNRRPALGRRPNGRRRARSPPNRTAGRLAASRRESAARLHRFQLDVSVGRSALIEAFRPAGVPWLSLAVVGCPRWRVIIGRPARRLGAFSSTNGRVTKKIIDSPIGRSAISLRRTRIDHPAQLLAGRLKIIGARPGRTHNITPFIIAGPIGLRRRPPLCVRLAAAGARPLAQPLGVRHRAGPEQLERPRR
jgi:hypothetical protein